MNFLLFFFIDEKVARAKKKDLRWAETRAKICVASQNLFWKLFLNFVWSLTIYGMGYLENHLFSIV